MGFPRGRAGFARRMRQSLQELGHPRGDRFGDAAGRREEPAGTVGAMLDLGHEVDGDHLGISRVVGDDGDFGRAGEDVDPDLAEQQALGLRHIFVAGPDHHVGRRAGHEAMGHGRDGLDAAERQDDVGPGRMHGVKDGWMDAVAVKRSRAGDDRLHPRRLRRGDGHVG